MGHILHILKDAAIDQVGEALAVLKAQAKVHAKVHEGGADPPRLLLIQEAVRLRLQLPEAVKVYVLKEDLERHQGRAAPLTPPLSLSPLPSPSRGEGAGRGRGGEGQTPMEVIGYREMLDLIFQAGTIIVW